MNDKIFGVIPARGGSKGIPGKNLRNLCGKPLIFYIIKAALRSKTLDSVYVSTDDKNIARQAKLAGAKVILHPLELSTDSALTFGVIKNALNYFNEEKLSPNIIVTMRPTSPLCLPSDIDSAVYLLQLRQDIDAVISVTRSSVHPYRILKIIKDGLLKPYGYTTEELYPKQRQSFETVYIRNGAIYVSRKTTIEKGGLWGVNNLAYVMPPERSVNINEEIDFILAEAILKKDK